MTKHLADDLEQLLQELIARFVSSSDTVLPCIKSRISSSGHSSTMSLKDSHGRAVDANDTAALLGIGLQAPSTWEKNQDGSGGLGARIAYMSVWNRDNGWFVFGLSLCEFHEEYLQNFFLETLRYTTNAGP